MRRPTIALTLALLTSSLAQAAPPPITIVAPSPPAEVAKNNADRLSAARQLMSTMHMEDLIWQEAGPVLPVFIRRTTEAVLKRAPALQGPPSVERRQRVYMLVSRDIGAMIRQSTPDIVDMRAKAYASLYTLAELRAMIAFYGLPLGQEVARKSVALEAATQTDALRAVIVRLGRFTSTPSPLQSEIAAALAGPSKP